MRAGEEGQDKRENLDAYRPRFFSALADGDLQDLAVMRADDELLEQDIAQRGCEIQQTIHPDRQHCKMVFSDPACRYRLE